MSDVPYFLETRVRQGLARAHEVARLKGLRHAFDVDLFAADRAVQDLLGPPAGADDPHRPGAGTPDGARAAQVVLAKLDDLLGRLQAAHDRGPQHGDAPVGRAGRRAVGRR
jgi:hypothetical protein